MHFTSERGSYAVNSCLQSCVAKTASVCKRRKKDSLLTIFTKMLCNICRNSIECKRFARLTKIISFLAEFV